MICSTMIKPRVLFPIAAILLLNFCAPDAGADVIYDNGLVNDLSTYQSGSAQVIDGPGGAITTLNVLPGGEIQFDLLADQNSIVNVSGGVIRDDLTAAGFSVLTVSGGQIGAGPNALGNGRVIVLGNFNFAYGDYDSGSGLADQFLTGTLADGTTIGNQIFIYDDAIVTLAPAPDVTPVPEPSTFALSALGLLTLGSVGWRRRRR